MGEFKVISTQEEFDAAIAERLKRQKEQYESKMKDYDAVVAERDALQKELSDTRSVLDENKVAADSFNAQIEELNGKIRGFELKDLKTMVAIKHGIPYELAGRLVGEDEESLTNDAVSLSQMISHKEPIAPLKSVEPQPSGKDSAYRNLLNGLDLEGE